MSLQDRFDIIEMLGVYANAWDAKDADAWAACFTEDGAMDIWRGGEGGPPARGRDSLRKVAARSFAGRLATIQTRHFQTNTVFLSLTETEAQTRTMLQLIQVRPDEPHPRVEMTGLYDDDWARTGEGWRLKRRSLHVDTPPGQPGA
jgi:hypothetical protein